MNKSFCRSFWRLYLEYWGCVPRLWRTGKWYEGPVMAFVFVYAHVGLVLMVFNNFFGHFLPKWAIISHFTLLGIGAVYSFIGFKLARREWKKAIKSHSELKKALDDSLITFLEKIAPHLNFTDRPSVVELSKVAEIVFITRNAKLESHQAELQSLENWVKHWDEEKVKQS